MPESYAQQMSRALEQIRACLHGPQAALVLLDKSAAEVATISASFSVKRRTNLALGESFMEARIAETSHTTGEVQMTQAMALKAVSARFKGVEYTASQGDDPMTEARVFALRLTPTKRRQA